ncbi:MAG: roadblock/LC7 domain-containing protein [Candidatus Mcinerneyibacterium aminivorans]|uniref:Roadblock/LC7 domain-containing protein n=1 Tax=Candidatus Mcinerneyibacterium aminivorans TaxID=2703815 RepID=A0A5D0MEM9_9BACT|nr:MAG: roadblock/LC7 domain-containing protein [Candidatus Mcinerneyibacterium aminivorans]
MNKGGMVIPEEGFSEINEVLDNLLERSSSECAFLVDKSGQLISMRGDMDKVDSAAFASLSAGNFAATSELAKLIGEEEFSVLFHEGDTESIHISIVARNIIMVIVFRTDETSLGLVRLEMKKTIKELIKLFKDLNEKSKKEKGKKQFNDSFTKSLDDEIDNLFKDKG